MFYESALISLHLRVNEEAHSLQVAPMKRLIDILREDLRLTGTKEGCGEGECGACTVIIDGELACSCLVPAFHIDGADIETVESVAKNGRMSTFQDEMVRCGGAQCGMCIPGIVMTCEALFRNNQQPSTQETREALAGNLCRCTGYTRIFEAVEKAAQHRSDS